MLFKLTLLFFILCSVVSYPQEFRTNKFKIGIEYDHSLPMAGGSDKYRHRNNYDPFYVTITATAKKNYVISYLEVTTTTDIQGESNFCLIHGKAGSHTVVFQLMSNNTDFLSYSYLTYGILEEEYKKITNVVTLPMEQQNNGMRAQAHFIVFVLLNLKLYLFY